MTQPDYQQKDLNEFDPNSKNSQPWATYCPSRRGAAFKTHRARHIAMSSLSQHSYGTLYEWSDGQWEEVARKCEADHDGRCDVCHGRAETAVGSPRFARTIPGSFDWERIRGRIVTPLRLLFLCHHCSMRNG